LAPIIEGDNEVDLIVVPQFHDAQPAVVRAQLMKAKLRAETNLTERKAKKKEVCVLFKAYSDNSFRDLVKTKPLVKTAFNESDIPVVIALWHELFNNGPVVAAAGAVNTAKEIAEAVSSFDDMYQSWNTRLDLMS